MSLWSKIALLVAIQTLTVLAIVADKQWTLSTGTPVLLQTQPIDPRSLFMGDYVSLSYSISALPLDGEAAVAGDQRFAQEDTVWVAIKPNVDGAQAVSVHHQRSAISPGLLALKGKVQRLDENMQSVAGRIVKRRTLHVRYGIEQYYVQEGTGHQIERPRGNEKVSVRVAIDARGQAGILALLLDGEVRYQERLL